MRLIGGLAATALASLAAAAAAAAAASSGPSQEKQQQPLAFFAPGQQQQHFPTALDPPILRPATSTLVDVLSASADYSTLLRLLQRTQLVPALNELANGTLFAPTNAAFEAAGHKEAATLANWAWADEEGSVGLEYDNVLRRTRELLLYHLLNSSLPLSAAHPSPPGDGNGTDALALNSSKGHRRRRRPLFPEDHPLAFETLLYPSPDENDRPSKPGPWLPSPTGQLGHEGQRLRAIRRPVAEADGKSWQDWVGVDGAGGGGVKVEGEPVEAGNGIVVRVDGVLEVPADVGSTIISHPDLSYLSALLSPAGLPPPSPVPPESYLALLHSLPTLSLFAPSNEAFAALPQAERTYLESGFAKDDIEVLVSLHASRAKDVAWRERFERSGEGEVEVVGGRTAWVTVDGGGAMEVGMEAVKEDVKDGAKVTEADVYCSNGVVHIVDRLLVPPFKVTTEKILIGLNATRFVSLLRDASLAGYVNGSAEGEAYTILAPVDLPPVAAGQGPPDHLRALQETLRYHILPGRIRPADLKDGGLLSSELRTPLLKHGRQVVPVDVRRSVLGHLGANAIPLGRSGDGEDDDWAEVQFGGVEVVSEPVEVGRSIVYLVKAFLDPPRDFVETAVASLDLTTFLAATFAARVDDTLRHAAGVTMLAPDNHAFARLGLGRDYLLLPEARSQLRDVLRHHVIDEVLYLEDLRAGGQKHSKTYPTIGGGSLAVEVGANSTIHVGAGGGGNGVERNGEQREATVLRGDAITSNGALHVVDQVLIPPSVNITVGNLLRGAKATVMADLLERAGLEWILNGTDPSPSELERLGIAAWVPEDTTEARRSDADLEPPYFTVLVPTDDAFAAVNITSYLRNTSSPSALIDLLKLHILPSRQPIGVDPKLATRSSTTRLPPPKGAPSRPLAVEEDVAYLTLLSATSRFGDLAFRHTRDAFVVGIKGARGIELNDWADVGASGRATPRVAVASAQLGGDMWEKTAQHPYLINGVTHGGGIFLIDSVLVPFEPSWAQLYGWIVVAAIVGGAAALSLVGLGVWWLWQRRSRSGTDYEPVEEEED